MSGSPAQYPLMTAPAGFRTRVVRSWQPTPTTHAIKLEKPGPFVFGPTQFTFLQLSGVFGVQTRPMSLATSPTHTHLEYAARLSESPFKHALAALRPGDEVAIFGPFGDFILDESRPAVFVAGGVGVTPFKGMAEYAVDRSLTIPIRLVYSSRDEREIMYRDELKSSRSQERIFSHHSDPHRPGH